MIKKNSHLTKAVSLYFMNFIFLRYSLLCEFHIGISLNIHNVVSKNTTKTSRKEAANQV